MLFRRNIILLLMVLSLVLTGCFRQASDPDMQLENTSNNNSEQTIPPTATDLPAGEGLIDDPQPTAPDLSSDNGGTTDDQTNPDDGATSVPITVLPRFTQPPPPTAAPQTSGDDSGNSGGAASETPQFVTPFTMPTVPGQVQTSPTPDSSGQIVPQPSGGLVTPTAIGGSSDGCSYTVQPGDTFYRIALGNNLTVAELVAANPQISNPDILSPGDVLQIPGCGQGSDAAAPPDAAVAPPADGGSSDSGIIGGSGQRIHVVQRGETLFSIAQQYGVTVQQIVDANNLQNPNVLSPGQQLIIPTSGG